MSEQKFVTGDRVRVPSKPEWGIGTVMKVETVNGAAGVNGSAVHTNGHLSQRLNVRFPNAGVKSIVTGYSVLERVNEAADPLLGEDVSTVKFWDKLNDSDWLAPMARKKIEEALITLPQEVRDPFNSLQKRLQLTLNLYRFDRSGRGLMDWAVAQTGLDDPLSRFTRQELEQKFDRWAHEREAHLAKVLQEARAPGQSAALLNEALKNAPPAAVKAVRRITGAR